MSVLPIAYFPPISWFKALLLEDAVIEKHENYVKQTLRNRCHIATANGVQRLTVPVCVPRNFEAPIPSNPSIDSIFPKPLTTEILVSPKSQRKHWQAIATAYGESAFFDYYTDDIHEVLFSEEKNLFAYDLQIIRRILELLETDKPLRFTESFMGEDYTQRISNPSNSLTFIVPPYYQVFRQKTGFLPDLSILDLLFNLGPEASCYLVR